MATDSKPVIVIISLDKESQWLKEVQYFAHYAENVTKCARCRFANNDMGQVFNGLKNVQNVRSTVILIEGSIGIVLWSNLLQYIHRGGSVILVASFDPQDEPKVAWLHESLQRIPVPWTLSTVHEKQFHRNKQATLIHMPGNLVPTISHRTLCIQNVDLTDAWYVADGTYTQYPAWERQAARPQIPQPLPSSRINPAQRKKFGPVPQRHVEDDDLPNPPPRQHPYGAANMRLTSGKRPLGVQSRSECCPETPEQRMCFVNEVRLALEGHGALAGLGPVEYAALLSDAAKAILPDVAGLTSNKRPKPSVSSTSPRGGPNKVSRVASPDYGPSSSSDSPTGADAFLRTPSTGYSGSYSGSIHSSDFSPTMSDNLSDVSDMPQLPSPVLLAPATTTKELPTAAPSLDPPPEPPLADYLSRAEFGRERAKQANAQPIAPKPLVPMPKPVEDPHLQNILRRAGFGRAKTTTTQQPPNSVPPRRRAEKLPIPTGPGWKELCAPLLGPQITESSDVKPESSPSGYPVVVPVFLRPPAPVLLSPRSLPPWRLPQDLVHSTSLLYGTFTSPETKPRERESASSTAQVSMEPPRRRLPPPVTAPTPEKAKKAGEMNGKVSEPPPQVETPVALARVGRGTIGFVGQYVPSPEFDRMLLELCRRAMGETD